VIVLDNSILVDSLTGPRKSYPALRRVAASFDPLAVPALVLYEWLRGPRLPVELDDLTAIRGPESIIPFGPQEASLAAELYLAVRRPRSRAYDLAIAACAILRSASLWTLNPKDFQDIPNLRLYRLP